MTLAEPRAIDGRLPPESRCKVKGGVKVNVAVDVKVRVKVNVEDKVNFQNWLPAYFIDISSFLPSFTPGSNSRRRR
jgi:hypothetical protein